MRAVVNHLVRWLSVIALGAVTFWPGWGLVWLAIGLFPAYPVPVTIASLVWSIVLGLALPLTLRQFRISSTAAIVAVLGVCTWLAWQSFPDAVIGDAWFMWPIGILFAAFGWWKTATPLWRWANNIVAVQQTAPMEHEHHEP